MKNGQNKQFYIITGTQRNLTKLSPEVPQLLLQKYRNIIINITTKKLLLIIY